MANGVAIVRVPLIAGNKSAADVTREVTGALDAKPAAEIALSARIVDKNGKIAAARLFEESEKFDQVTPPEAVAAFSAAFGRIAKDMIAWTVEAQ